MSIANTFRLWKQLRFPVFVYFIAAYFSYFPISVTQNQAEHTKLSVETVQDKIRGGLLGQILGNLNGLEHENRYIAEPGMRPVTSLPCQDGIENRLALHHRCH